LSQMGGANHLAQFISISTHGGANPERGANSAIPPSYA